jgi:hypothetical protein
MSSLSMLGRSVSLPVKAPVAVYGDPPGRSESTVKAGRFDDESL